MPEPPTVRAGDEVELRKPHACGANRWLVVRTGADLRLQCLSCRHSLLLPRDKFAKAVRSILRTAPQDDQTPKSD